MRLVLILILLAEALGAQDLAPQRHGRLFPPQDLGLLEGPDRDAWQKPEQIMDALGIADGSAVAGLYAVGLDANSMMHGTYPGGGSSIGPAMVFGYRAALRLAR